MFFKKNKTEENNVMNDKDFKERVKKAKFVFSYNYGYLMPKNKNFTSLVVVDNEVTVKKIFNDESKNKNKTFIKEEQTKQIKEYFMLPGVIKQLETISNIPLNQLKTYKSSRIDYIYIKVNNKEYKFDGNASNPEYRKFLEKIIKKVYTFLNINYTFSNNKYQCSISAPAKWLKLGDDYGGHPIFEFKSLDMGKSEVLFKFSDAVSFSPALYGLYTIERLGLGSLEQFNKLFVDFVDFIKSDKNNYRIIKEDELEIANKKVNRLFLNYIKSNISTIIDYVYFNDNIIVIGCPLCLNLEDSEALKSKNIEINNKIIKSLKINNSKNTKMENNVTEGEIKTSEVNVEKLISDSKRSFSYTTGIILPPNDKKCKTITLLDNCIIEDDNGNIEQNNDKELINKLWEIIDSFAQEIINSAEKTQTIEKEKCNKIKNIILKLEDSEYYWNGKVANKEINSLFNDITNAFLEVYNKNIQITENLKEDEIKEKIKNADFVFSYTKGTFNPTNKNYKAITLVDDYVVIDDNGNVSIKQDELLTKKMWLSITVNTDLIIRCSQDTKNLPHIKDSSKDEIILKQKDKTYLFSGKITDEKHKKIYNDVVDRIMTFLRAEENIENYEKLKREDHLLISSWYGKKEVGIQEKLITLQKGNAGYVYSFEKKMGDEYKLDNKTITTKVTEICRLDPILLVELKKYIVEEEKLFEKNIENGMSLDRGTKISIQLDGKSIVIRDVEEYYTKISTKINKLIEEDNIRVKKLHEKIANVMKIDKGVISKEEFNDKFKTADKNFFYMFGSMAMKDYKIIRLVENYIAKEEYFKGKSNSKIVIDDSIATKVWNIIDSKIEEIKKCSEDIEKVPRIVDGYNDSIIIKYNNESYGFSSKTEDEKIQKIYKEISTEILQYLDI